MRLSERQLQLLRLVDEFGGFDGWAEAWSHWDFSEGKAGFTMMNFDRIADALKRRGLIAHVGEYGIIEVTEEGKKILAKECCELLR